MLLNIMLYKSLKGKARIPTDDLIPTTRHCRNNHSLAFQLSSASMEAYKCSFFPKTFRDWNGFPDSLFSTAEMSDDCVSLQNKTVRFIKNLGPRSHIGFSELDSLKMLNVDFRVKQLRLSHVHKINNETGPSYMSEQFIKTSEVHHHFTRNSIENFVLPSLCVAAATTFYYNAIKDWNSVPLDVKQKRSFNGFKSAAKQYLRTQLKLIRKQIISYTINWLLVFSTWNINLGFIFSLVVW